MDIDAQYITPIVFYESENAQVFRNYSNTIPVMINQNKFPPLYIPMRGIQFRRDRILEYFNYIYLKNKNGNIIYDLLPELDNANFRGVRNETNVSEPIRHFMIGREFNFEMPFNSFYFEMQYKYPRVTSSATREIYSNLICTKSITEPTYNYEIDYNLLLPINWHYEESQFLENRYPNESNIIPLTTNNRILPFQIERDHNASNVIDAFELVDSDTLETKYDLTTVTDAPIIVYNQTLEKDNIIYFGLQQFTTGILTGTYRMKIDDNINVYYSDKINILSEVIIPNSRDFLLINDTDYFIINGSGDKILIKDT